MNKHETNKTTESLAVDSASAGSTKWVFQMYGSGTHVVIPTPRGDSPHFYVCHPAADNKGGHLRYEIAKELETWLNGGDAPWWLDMLNRKSAETVTTPHGADITATGPMVDVDPPHLNWRTDMSDDAVIARGLLTDALMKRERPI